jgi:hypothetical protein
MLDDLGLRYLQFEGTSHWLLRSPCHLTSDALTQGRSFTMGGDELSGAPGTKQVSLEVHSRAALAYVARGVLFSLGSMPNFEERES